MNCRSMLCFCYYFREKSVGDFTSAATVAFNRSDFAYEENWVDHKELRWKEIRFEYVLDAIE